MILWFFDRALFVCFLLQSRKVKTVVKTVLVLHTGHSPQLKCRKATFFLSLDFLTSLHRSIYIYYNSYNYYRVSPWRGHAPPSIPSYDFPITLLNNCGLYLWYRIESTGLSISFTLVQEETKYITFLFIALPKIKVRKICVSFE